MLRTLAMSKLCITVYNILAKNLPALLPLEKKNFDERKAYWDTTKEQNKPASKRTRQNIMYASQVNLVSHQFWEESYFAWIPFETGVFNLAKPSNSSLIFGKLQFLCSDQTSQIPEMTQKMFERHTSRIVTRTLMPSLVHCQLTYSPAFC